MERDQLIQLLRSAAPAGEQISPSGTVRLGPVPIVAPLAYLHSVHTPLDEQGIAVLQRELPVMIPPAYRQFLQIANGLRLFVSTVALLGLRSTAARDASSMDWPYSILLPNLHERPAQLEAGSLIVGVHTDDKSPLVMHHAASAVSCLTPDGGAVRATWPDLDSFLQQEVARLARLLEPDYAGLRMGAACRKLPGQPLPVDHHNPVEHKPWWRVW
jgi:hypothetical protein